MTDYQIQANTRRCALTGRELQPGEKCYTVLREEGDKFVRQDFSADAWQGPPPGAFSYWLGHIPPREENQRPRFDDDMLLDCLQRLDGQTEPRKVSFRYVVALLLMRRKRLRFDKTVNADGVDKLCLRCPRSGAEYQVVDPRLSEEELDKVQEDVLQVVGWH